MPEKQVSKSWRSNNDEIERLKKQREEYYKQIKELEIKIRELSYTIDNLRNETANQKYDRRKELEKECDEKWRGNINPGDMVRVVGVKNATAAWRKIVDTTKYGIVGQQYARNRIGKFIPYNYMTENSYSKIAEVIRKGSWEINERS